MKRFIEGEDQAQNTLFPESLDEYIGEDSPVRAIDAFVDELDLGALGFDGVEPENTGRPAYHPSILLKIYIYGYLNRIQSSRRLERETRRNVELIWLTCRLTPDCKTIADFARPASARFDDSQQSMTARQSVNTGLRLAPVAQSRDNAQHQTIGASPAGSTNPSWKPYKGA